MRLHRNGIAREEVIKCYAAYDWRKKRKKRLDSLLADLNSWEWDDPDLIDQRLDGSHLKKGVLSAYKTWQLIEFNIVDLLECAIVDHIFPNEPQMLGRLLLRGKLAEWFPTGSPDWWQQIGGGLDLGVESPLIMRKALPSEAPAKWYVEDGSGRALALLQRILRYGEIARTVWVYLGDQPDERSRFMKDHPVLMR
jgi:hypothetical protein